MAESTKVAVVTGASRGIGRSIAGVLAEAGYRVIGTATGDAGIESIERLLSGAGHAALKLDVADDDSIEQFVQALDEADLKPGVLINNAGITRDNLVLRMKDQEWDDVIAADLTSVYKLSKRFIRPMVKARWGRIVNITSVVGVSGNAGQANYAAAKAGIIGFTKSLAREVANRGITVNAVAPGFIDTDMTQSLTDEQRAAMLAQVPAGRLGSGDDIAHAVLYLISDHAGYVTGETLHINGGMYMA